MERQARSTQISTQPIGPSAAFVETIWFGPASNGSESSFVIQPDGRVDAVLAFNEQGGELLAFGSSTHATRYELKPSHHYLGIRFKPGKSIAFLDAHPSELRDQAVSVEHFAGLDTGHWLELVLADTENAERLSGVLNALNQYANPLPDQICLMDELVRYVERRNGVVNVKELAYQAGLSARQLERRFLDYVGMSPKLFARVVRYNQVRQALAHGESLNANLAARLGYTDQSHLWHDFRAFTATSTV